MQSDQQSKQPPTQQSHQQSNQQSQQHSHHQSTQQHTQESKQELQSQPMQQAHAQLKRFKLYCTLTKPRVSQLAVFCAVIGMFLSVRDGLPPWKSVIGGAIGIWLLAAGAFAINCLVERKIDARMKRTAWRPSAQGEITPAQNIIFSLVLLCIGITVLYLFTNPLTVWMTFATFLAYSLIYTVLLKPMTPQNIVIGGAAGAMPPALGWAAITGHMPAEAWLLVLIIFAWTPPHFWALALYRRKDYAEAGLPMLPITHGEKFTRLHILLYVFVLSTVTFLPFIHGMSGYLYGFGALVLDIFFLMYAWKLWRNYSDELAKKTFRFSIVYLTLLFAFLLIDHYI